MSTPFWKPWFYWLFWSILILSTSLFGLTIVSASDPEDRAEGEAAQSEETVSGLPAWEEGDIREGFDVRIWPERIVWWLEQENLRDLIADPTTPGPEKEALRRVLAMQQVWPKNL